MQVGAVLRAEKIARSAARLRKISARKWANSLQIRCAVDAQRTKTSAGVAAKTFWRLRISASSFWRVQFRKRTRPTSNMRKILPKFASMTQEFAAKFSPFRRTAQQTLRLFCEDSDLKLARRRRSSNARRRRVAHRKNRAFSAAIAQIFRQKMREFVANSLRGRRATHQDFGQRRCENIVTLHNFCVDFLARAMPKTRASSGRTCAKLCQILHQ